MSPEDDGLIGNPNAMTLALLNRAAIEHHVKEDGQRFERIETALQEGKTGRARLHDKLEAGVAELRNLILAAAKEMRDDARETRHSLGNAIQELVKDFERMDANQAAQQKDMEDEKKRVDALELAMDGQKGINKYRGGAIAVIALLIGVFGLYALQRMFP